MKLERPADAELAGKRPHKLFILAKSIGYLIAFLSLLYVVSRLHSNLYALPSNWLAQIGDLWFLLSVFFFVVSVGFGFLTWHLLIVQEDQKLAVFSSAHVYFVSQIGKYIPGNVAQHIGRVALARERGVPFAKSVVFVFIETSTIIIASVLCIAISFALQPELVERTISYVGLANASIPFALIATVLIALAAILAFLLFSSSALAFKAANTLKKYIFSWRLLPLVGCGILALSSLGISFLLLVAGSLSLPGLGAAGAIGIVTVAWLLGFVTPGAPAGLGVREFVFLGLLSPSFGEPSALQIALAFRLVSVAGDIVIFGMGIAAGFASRKATW